MVLTKISSKQLSSHVLTVAGIRVRNALQVLKISFWVDMDFKMIFWGFLDNQFGFLGEFFLDQVCIYEKALHLSVGSPPPTTSSLARSMLSCEHDGDGDGDIDIDMKLTTTMLMIPPPTTSSLARSKFAPSMFA